MIYGYGDASDIRVMWDTASSVQVVKILGGRVSLAQSHVLVSEGFTQSIPEGTYITHHGTKGPARLPIRP